MKLICVSCLYERPHVSEIFLRCMSRIGIKVIAAVSTREDVMVCEKAGVEWWWIRNEPLGKKWNEIIQLAMDNYSFTHMMISGDDDLYSEEYLAHVNVLSHHPFIGLRQMYMASPSQEKAIKFRYKVPIAIGSGRVYHRGLIQKLRRVDGSVDMFEDSANKSLDHYADFRLMEVGKYIPRLIDAPVMVGIKTKKNIWPIENFEGDHIEYSEAIGILPEEEQKLINKL